MPPSYPYLHYFWAAYGVTALIYLVYGVSLYRRYLLTKRTRLLADAVHTRSQPR